jgi:3-deoxy-D-manno-octulosonate 8-phosphate phosphatase (KDO 8-P phosphatase)
MSYLDKLADIKHFIFDVDGVLTNGCVQVQENGDLLRQMHTRDGYALKTALEQKFSITIITGGNSIGVIKRLEVLGIKDIHSNIKNKLKILEEMVHSHNLDLNQVAYMGDDLPDYECMRAVHLAACPTDAAMEIKTVSQYISPYKGGEGCVRDLIEKVLKAQNKWKIENR